MQLMDKNDFLDLFYVASAGQDEWFVNTVEMVIEDTPTIDAVPVVRCRDCYLHGECMTEDAFHWSGIQNPYCAAGKKVGE